MLNLLMSSGGTLPKSTLELIGINTFFAPLSKHTCSVLDKFGILFIVPPILMVPSIAVDCITGLFSAIEHSPISVASDSSAVIPMLFTS